MATTIHRITVGVKDKTNLDREVRKVFNRLKRNTQKGKANFIQFITLETQKVAKQILRRNQFTGELRDSITAKFFKKTGKGSVFIPANQRTKALMNERGVLNPVPVPMTPELQAWAQKKAPHLANRRFINVGFPGSRSHVIQPTPVNQFWEPTAKIMNANMAKFFAKYLKQIVKDS